MLGKRSINAPSIMSSTISLWGSLYALRAQLLSHPSSTILMGGQLPRQHQGLSFLVIYLSLHGWEGAEIAVKV